MHSEEIATEDSFKIEPSGAYGLIHNYSDDKLWLYMCIGNGSSPTCTSPKSPYTGKPLQVPPGKEYKVDVTRFGQSDYYAYATKYEPPFDFKNCSRDKEDWWHFMWSDSPITDLVPGENGTKDDFKKLDVCAMSYVDAQFVVLNKQGKDISIYTHAKGKINGTDVDTTKETRTQKSMLYGIMAVTGAKDYGEDYLWSCDVRVSVAINDPNTNRTLKQKDLYIKGGTIPLPTIPSDSIDCYVKTPDDDPIEGAEVTATPCDQGEPCGGETAGSCTTDSDGYCRISGLDPDTAYKYEASKEGYKCASNSPCSSIIKPGQETDLYLEEEEEEPTCEDYNNQADCEAAGCYWYNGACHSSAPSCSDLDNQSDCEAAGCYWYNGACHAEPESTCADYDNQSDCEAAGCHWWSDGTCHAEAEPEEGKPACVDALFPRIKKGEKMPRVEEGTPVPRLKCLLAKYR